MMGFSHHPVPLSPNAARHQEGIGCHGGRWFSSKEKCFRKTNRTESVLRLPKVMLEKYKFDINLDRK